MACGPTVREAVHSCNENQAGGVPSKEDVLDPRCSVFLVLARKLKQFVVVVLVDHLARPTRDHFRGVVCGPRYAGARRRWFPHDDQNALGGVNLKLPKQLVLAHLPVAELGASLVIMPLSRVVLRPNHAPGNVNSALGLVGAFRAVLLTSVVDDVVPGDRNPPLHPLTRPLALFPEHPLLGLCQKRSTR